MLALEFGNFERQIAEREAHVAFGKAAHERV
jgi:hypothetical protein